jgi:hypothetical protein
MFRPLAQPRSRVESLLLAAALCVTLPGVAHGQKVMTSIEPDRMTRILEAAGIEVSEYDGDVKSDGEEPPLVVELGDYQGLLFLLNDNTDAQLFIVFNADLSTEKMNEWNREHRFARAYRDDEGRAVLEGDLDFVGGVTEPAVQAWATLFRDLAVDYGSYAAD